MSMPSKPALGGNNMKNILTYVCGDIEASYDDEDYGVEFKNEVTNYLKWELIGENREAWAGEPTINHTLSFPWQWANDSIVDGKFFAGQDGQGNPRVEDPLTVYLTLYVGAGCNGITFKTSLSDMVDDMYEIHLLGDHVDTEVAKHIKIFRDALYKEVEKLDKVIAEARDDDA
jgi:hypothetical protein